MTFFALHEGFYEGVHVRLDLLKQACSEKGLDFVTLDSTTVDYTALPRLGKAALLYKLTRGAHALESLLLNDEVTTFYRQNPRSNFLRSSTDWSVVHDKIGLPAPKTIYQLPTDRVLLEKYVQYLGGFPVVLKVTGGTRGIGTIKIESWSSLFSTVDYLATTGDEFIMRQFIDAPYGARVMVLGDKVIAAAKFFMQENDFRNAPILAATRYESITLTPQVEDICLRACHSVNLDMGGVDILFDRQARPYLLEINFPTGFQAFKDNPQTILSQWLDYLIQKANRHEK